MGGNECSTPKIVSKLVRIGNGGKKCIWMRVTIYWRTILSDLPRLYFRLTRTGELLKKRPQQAAHLS